jgi:hypothetical protein
VPASAEPINELAPPDHLEQELLRVDCEQVEIAGDDRVSAAGCRERDEVVVVGIPANRRVRTRRISNQGSPERPGRR